MHCMCVGACNVHLLLYQTYHLITDLWILWVSSITACHAVFLAHKACDVKDCVLHSLNAFICYVVLRTISQFLFNRHVIPELLHVSPVPKSKLGICCGRTLLSRMPLLLPN